MAHFLDGKVANAEDVAAARGVGLPKGRTRLEQRMADDQRVVVTEAGFKKTVWTRDRYRCRCCVRQVVKTPAAVPERGEVHHIHGRGGELRFEDRAALLLCLRCHERVTGKVNDKLVIVGVRFFDLTDKTGPHRYIDARAAVTFRRVA